ncbi:hypothetical protein [Acaryochloris sp. IP29b_bin.148]|uniref:hypothetical protein n=1 Tax=Acaryochloris sp. IP29b_bin.148 TaxID=2969218 RepID=UPI0026300324|nr:hypothetical protein [Acaryochloris sp. IP29b_bin.148]
MAELPQSLSGLLTLEENAQIDQTLLPTRERFSIRLTVYCWRYLQQLSEKLQTPIESLKSEQIHEWVAKDTQLQEGQHVDADFMDWFSHLVTSSLKPLDAIAQQHQVPIHDLTFDKVIHWYVQSFG